MRLRPAKILRWLIRHPVTTLTALLLIFAILMCHRSYAHDDGIRYGMRDNMVAACDSELGHIWLEYVQADMDPPMPAGNGFWHYDLPSSDFGHQGWENPGVQFNRWGFTYCSGVHIWGVYDFDLQVTSFERGRFLAIPYWAICAILALPICWRTFALLRRRRPSQFLRCSQCNYDLRAHAPGSRCPECGHPIPAPVQTR